MQDCTWGRANPAPHRRLHGRGKGLQCACQCMPAGKGRAGPSKLACGTADRHDPKAPQSLRKSLAKLPLVCMGGHSDGNAMPCTGIPPQAPQEDKPATWLPQLRKVGWKRIFPPKKANEDSAAAAHSNRRATARLDGRNYDAMHWLNDARERPRHTCSMRRQWRHEPFGRRNSSSSRASHWRTRRHSGVSDMI